MKSFVQRVVQAYQPLCQRGLLLDERYIRPSPEAPAEALRPASRRRMLLVALSGPLHHSSSRSPP